MTLVPLVLAGIVVFLLVTAALRAAFDFRWAVALIFAAVMVMGLIACILAWLVRDFTVA